MKSLSKLSLWICVTNFIMSQICVAELFLLTQISRSHGILLKWLDFAWVLQSNNKYKRLTGMTQMWATIMAYLKAEETVYGLCVGSWTNTGKDCVQRVPHLISLHESLTRRSSGKTENWVEPFLSGRLALTPPLCCRANVRYKISQVDYICGYK